MFKAGFIMNEVRLDVKYFHICKNMFLANEPILSVISSLSLSDQELAKHLNKKINLRALVEFK